MSKTENQALTNDEKETLIIAQALTFAILEGQTRNIEYLDTGAMLKVLDSITDQNIKELLMSWMTLCMSGHMQKAFATM